ncbi:MAG: exosortase [Flavobacteriaceae bacterium]|nr:exosortase [Flavobacteriaceae bacterium]|tara:strand:- start:57960 stop:58769 length:810 start_codon:yes stop_codon:yes gene_type:complete
MKHIPLYWWSEIFIQKKDRENYGDLLGKYLVEKISGRPVQWIDPKKAQGWFFSKKVYATIGSILGHIKKGWIVWGSGIISRDTQVPAATFLAVRGPQTRTYLLEKGYAVPEVYGDPALLLPNYYQPEVAKTHALGIIPHISDYAQVSEQYQNLEGVKVISLFTNDIEATTREILSCESIISSSLHGLIVPHAYGIPAVWAQFSDRVFGDGIKYRDYFESVALPPYQPEMETEIQDIAAWKHYMEWYPALPDTEVLESLKHGLLAVCPWK